MDAALENAPCSIGGVTTDEGNSGSGGRVSCARDLVSGHVGSVMFGAQRGSLGTRGRPAEPQLALVTGGHGDHALPLEWPTDVDDFTFCTTTFSTTDGEMVLRSVLRLDVMDNPAVVDVARCPSRFSRSEHRCSEGGHRRQHCGKWRCFFTQTDSWTLARAFSIRRRRNLRCGDGC